MYKPKYFRPSELLFSATALCNNIPNDPSSWEHIENLATLCEKILDPARELLGTPIFVNSAYRTPTINKRVNGATNSYHLRGCAADITPHHAEQLDRLYNILKSLSPTELIKYDNFIHVAYEKSN